MGEVAEYTGAQSACLQAHVLCCTLMGKSILCLEYSTGLCTTLLTRILAIDLTCCNEPNTAAGTTILLHPQGMGA